MTLDEKNEITGKTFTQELTGMDAALVISIGYDDANKIHMVSHPALTAVQLLSIMNSAVIQLKSEVN